MLRVWLRRVQVRYGHPTGGMRLRAAEPAGSQLSDRCWSVVALSWPPFTLSTQRNKN